MIAIVGILMALIVIAVLAYPFLKRSRNSEAGLNETQSVASADTLRYLLYREPVTLRNEFEEGNITAEEYEEQLDEVRLQAAQLMRERDEHRYQMIEAELAIEQEVQRIRQARLADTPEDDSATS